MRWQPVKNQLREGLRLDEDKGGTAGRKVGRKKTRNQIVPLQNRRFNLKRLGNQHRHAIDDCR